MLILPWVQVSECLRCHKRKADYGYATIFVEPPSEGWNDYLELNWTLDTAQERTDEERRR